ncbi:MAG: hypothetical protein KDA96_26825, partial [Planctomycetaceae bacterium]|nr:hypothetical protein [Planctomycetaceae bacterium]
MSVNGPLRRELIVTDSGGRPIADATVTAQGFGTQNGAGWGWFDDYWPRVFRTDVDGKAVIELSVQHLAIIPENCGSVTFISVSVEHPSFAKEERLAYQTAESIVLSPGVVVRPQAVDAIRGQPVTTELYAVSGGQRRLDWNYENGQLTSPRLNTQSADGSSFFRIVRIPAESDAVSVLFSDVVDATALQERNGVATPELPLYPGVPLSGQVSDNVPRPLPAGGRVIATILGRPLISSDNSEPAGGSGRCGWSDVAELHVDGTFTFPSLPRHSHVELIAVCDGWVSMPESTQLEDYDRIHGTQFKSLSAAGQVTSSPVRLEREPVETVVSMVPTGSCVFRVVDQTGAAVELATISCFPNHSTSAGSTWLGYGTRSMDVLRNRQSSVAADQWSDHFTRVTGADGSAVIDCLPAGSVMATCTMPGHQVISPASYFPGFDGITAVIRADRESEVQIQLLQVGDKMAMPEAMSLSGRFPLLLRVVDEAGRTLPDAVVRTTGVNFEGGDTAESWGADWRVSDHRTVDGGLVLLEIE